MVLEVQGSLTVEGAALRQVDASRDGHGLHAGSRPRTAGGDRDADHREDGDCQRR